MDAFQFGAGNMTEPPIAYDKTRISGSTKTTYILHDKGGCMPGQKDVFTASSRNAPEPEAPIRSNNITRAFQIEKYKESKKPSGIKFAKTFRDNFTYANYPPHDDISRELAINASYKQVFGNFIPMESERPIEPERRLRNGDINIREFIRELAKSTFYKKHYLESVNQQRCIELCFKHLLGRPPFNQEEIILSIEIVNNEGFDYYVDSLIDSIEYQEVFGEYYVPYQRCWNSPCSAWTSSFVNTAQLTQSYATSDNAIHCRKTLSNESSGVSQLLQNLTCGDFSPIPIPSHTKFPSTNAGFSPFDAIDRVTNRLLPYIYMTALSTMQRVPFD